MPTPKKSVLKTPENPRVQYIKDLETIFQKAMEAENFSTALKAKELLARLQGFFTPGDKPSIHEKPLDALSDTELEHLIQSLEKHIDPR